MRAWLIVAALALPARADLGWEGTLPKALEAARKSSAKVLVEFAAPWCYSCYYMDQNVLGRAAFAEAAKGVVLARLDVDQPDGRGLKSKYRVNFLPSFLVLDGAGRELGRIVGEQREEDFVRQLKDLLQGGKRTAEDEAVARLEGMLRRKEFDQAAKLVKKPAPASAKSLGDRADWRRLELRLGLKTKPTPEGLKAMVALNDGCDLAYDLLDALEGKPPKASIEGLRSRLEAWAERRLWVARAGRCADFRTGVEALADYYEAIDDVPAKTAILDRAAELLAAESGQRGVGADRNLDDDFRFFLDAAGKDQALEAHFQKLVGAYPADYVYSYRYAKWLAGHKRHADALPWIEKAAKLCYGANRLTVTKQQAEILKELGRGEEAAAILRREIKAYGAVMPKDVQPLRELLTAISSAHD